MTTPTTEKPANKASSSSTKTGGGDNPGIQSVSTSDVKDRTAPTSAADVIVGVNDDLSAVEYDEGAGATFVTIKGDIVEEFFFPDTVRPSYRILFHKGQVVAKSLVDAYNDAVAAAAERRRQVESGEAIVDIDSTTVASGTNAHLSA